MKHGIIRYYYDFLKQMQVNKSKYAFLQLCGKIEEYLVKEFISYIFIASKGERFALQNIGLKGEKKIDIVIVNGNIDEDDLNIEAAVEAKYLRNCHRYNVNNSAKDEISTALKELKNQTGKLLKDDHGGYGIHLHSKTKEIYGLVFSSFVSNIKDDPKKKIYYQSILDSEQCNIFRYHDLEKPYFRRIYDDVDVKVLDSTRFVTLRAGLWKKK